MNAKQFKVSLQAREFIQEQVKRDLEQNVIEPSSSPWNAPVIVVPKKPDAQGRPRNRMVINYRKLNAKTNKDNYPLPNIADIMGQRILGESQYFSIFDHAMGFNQIPIEGGSKKNRFFNPLRTLPVQKNAIWTMQCTSLDQTSRNRDASLHG